MKTKICMVVCALLALCFVLGACTPNPTPNTQDSTEQQQTEQQTEQETQETTTEVQTDPPIEIEVPKGELPDLTALLGGQSDLLELSFSAQGKTVSQLKSEGLTFVNGSLFQKSDAGLTTKNDNWDSVGFSKAISTDTYTLQAQFAVAQNDRGGQYNAAMVGMYCKAANNLFIDGGLWFSFRESTAAVYVKQGAERVITTQMIATVADFLTIEGFSIAMNLTMM